MKGHARVASVVAVLASAAWAQGDASNQPPQGSQDQQGVQSQLDELREELSSVKAELDASRPGSTKFLFTGYAFGSFVDEEGEDSTFEAGFSPIFLWKWDERLFFEGEVVLDLEEAETNTELEYADLLYILGDYATLGVGKFLNPSNYFIERLHPAWINKLPEAPLAFGESGLLPASQLGVQLRGAIPIHSSSLQYAVYLSNGPSLLTESAEEAGRLDSANFTDVNNGKAVGGRVGFRPTPELEVGLAFESARVGASDDPDFAAVDSSLVAVDAACFANSERLKGTLDVRGQWAWARVDDATYDASGALGFGPLTFDNESSGGYLQLAYRPANGTGVILEDVEGVIRYDALDMPDGNPAQFDESRWTLGIDYWLRPNAVFKLAYRIDRSDDPGEDANALLTQFAIGF